MPKLKLKQRLNRADEEAEEETTGDEQSEADQPEKTDKGKPVAEDIEDNEDDAEDQDTEIAGRFRGHAGDCHRINPVCQRRTAQPQAAGGYRRGRLGQRRQQVRQVAEQEPIVRAAGPSASKKSPADTSS